MMAKKRSSGGGGGNGCVAVGRPGRVLRWLLYGRGGARVKATFRGGLCHLLWLMMYLISILTDDDDSRSWCAVVHVCMCVCVRG